MPRETRECILFFFFSIASFGDGERERESEREREEEVGTSNRDEIYSFPPWQDLISFAVGLALDLAGL